MALVNTLTEVMPKILASGLLALRGEVLYTRLVNLDYSEEAKKKGATIDVPYSSSKTATDVTPAATSSAPTNTTEKTIPIALSNWKKANFGITDKEAGQIMATKHFMPMEMREAFKAMAGAINQSVAALHVNLFSGTGLAGTTPFATTASAIQARKLLNSQLAPKSGRNAILDWDAEAAALALTAFSDANLVGSAGVKITGEIGQKFGIWWNADEDAPTHTSGSLGGDGSTATVVDTAAAVGAKAVLMKVGATNAMALLEGDIFTFAGSTQQYCVTVDTAAAAAAANVSVAIEPGLKVALVGTEAVAGGTLNGGTGSGAHTALVATTDHVANMVFNRDCFALAMRAPGAGMKELVPDDNSITMGDPISGLVFRLEIIRQYKQSMFEIDALWGAQCVRRELGTKIFG